MGGESLGNISRNACKTRTVGYDNFLGNCSKYNQKLGLLKNRVTWSKLNIIEVCLTGKGIRTTKRVRLRSSAIAYALQDRKMHVLADTLHSHLIANDILRFGGGKALSSSVKSS